MKILVGKTFGIGNAVLAIPLIKALHSLGHDVDVLVGTTSDDGGAWQVMTCLSDIGYVGRIYRDAVPLADEYDIAVMAIPFDGRWMNGVHFKAKQVVDGRTRPDPKTTGLVSWEKHEIFYQMENAWELGWDKDVPSLHFLDHPQRSDILYEKTVYLGLGYKRDVAGFWKFKHWGNERYASLVGLLCDAGLEVVTTGDMGDLVQTINPIRAIEPRLRYIPTTNLFQAFAVVNSCHMYVGNDTGMMHVAAACDSNVLAIFMDNPPLVPVQKLITKNQPWPGPTATTAIARGDLVTPADVLEEALRCREGIRV